MNRARTPARRGRGTTGCLAALLLWIVPALCGANGLVETATLPTRAAGAAWLSERLAAVGTGLGDMPPQHWLGAPGTWTQSGARELLAAVDAGSFDDPDTAWISAYPELTAVLPEVANATRLLRLSAGTTAMQRCGLGEWPRTSSGHWTSRLKLRLSRVPRLGSPVDAPPELATDFSGMVTLEQQTRVLNAILDRVAAVSTPERPGIVQIDLDLTGLLPVVRIYQALHALGGELSIPELEQPELLPLLPTYSRRGFLTFAERTGLQARYPNADWPGIAARFEKHFWAQDLRSDVVTPGLHDFAQAVQDAGGVIVFNSARYAHLRTATQQTLDPQGLGEVRLVLHTQYFVSGSKDKARAQAALQKWGTPVALIDDTGSNLDAVGAVVPDLIRVQALPPGFAHETTPAEVPEGTFVIGTFERLP